MTSLSTFSKPYRSFLRELKSAEIFIEKMGDKPADLLHFFKEACLNRVFVRQKLGLMTLVLIRINEFALTQVLDWDEVMKVYSLYLRFGEKNSLIIPGDIKVHSITGDSVYSKMIFMRCSPILKKKWLKDPYLNEFNLKDFAVCLHSNKELDLVYKVFLTGDYTIFHTLSDHLLIAIFCQFKEWECDLSDNFYEVIKRRVNRYQFALAIYAYSAGLPLQAFCRSYLEDLEFHLAECSDHLIHSNFEIQIVNHEGSSEYLPIELNSFAENFKQNLHLIDKSFDDVFLEIIELAMRDQSILTVKKFLLRDMDEIKAAALKAGSSKKQKIARDTVKKVVFDGCRPLREISLVGFLIYFENVNSLELMNYPIVELNFIVRIAQEKPNLTSLAITDCLISEEILLAVAKYYTHLTSIQLKNIHVSIKALSAFIAMEKLIEMHILECMCSFPGEMPYSKIETLFLSHLSYHLREELEQAFKAFTCIKVLSVIHVSHFSLQMIANPAQLESLTLDCETLEKEIEANIDFNRFIHLKHLKVAGKPSDNLKSILIKWMRENRLKVVFLK